MGAAAAKVQQIRLAKILICKQIKNKIFLCIDILHKQIFNDVARVLQLCLFNPNISKTWDLFSIIRQFKHINHTKHIWYFSELVRYKFQQ